MAESKIVLGNQEEIIDEIVLICDFDSDNVNTIEDEGNKFLKNLSLTGFENENLPIEAMETGGSTDAEFRVDNHLESIKLLSLNDTNLPKDVSNNDKREHSGIPFIRTGRSANRAIYNVNKENINMAQSKLKPNDKLQLFKPSSQLNKQLVASDTRKPLGNNKSYTPNFRVPLSVKPNLSNNNKYLPRVAGYIKPKPATMPQSPKLSTSIRAEQRNKFNLQLKEKESQMRIIKQKENEIKEKESLKKLEILRKELVHKPEPIRKYQS